MSGLIILKEGFVSKHSEHSPPSPIFVPTMEEQYAREVAAQLRKPEGVFGRQVGFNMNEGNLVINLRALDVVDAQPGERILELGMGNGAFVKQLLGEDHTIKYTGADFSELMVEEAIILNQELVDDDRARFVLSDGLTIPFRDGEFDKAFTVNTIYFWTDAIPMLAEFRRVLKPGGELIIAMRPKDMMQLYPFTKYNFAMYSQSDLEELLTANGFTVLESTREMEGARAFGEGEQPTANVIVKARVN